ncbi:MAG: hypothetical protein ACKOT0_04430 [bacterium]
MRFRTTLTAIAALAVMALGLTAPVTAQAAPQRPDGAALVRIDGGTAFAKKLSEREYRIVVPQGASIMWMGPVKGRTTTGTFSPKALIAGWKALGHSAGRKAYTTLGWTEQGSGAPRFATVNIAKPRINSQGQMTFLVDPLRSRLSTTMEKFSINVTWAQPRTTRAYPTTFTPQNVDSRKNPTAQVQAVLQGPSNVSVTFYSMSSPTTPCWSYGVNLNVTSQQNLVKIPGTNCGNGHIDNKLPTTDLAYSQVFWSQAVYPYDGSVTVSYGYTPTGGTAFPWAFSVASFDEDGNDTSGKPAS